MKYEECLEDLYSLVDYERLLDYPREFDLTAYEGFLGLLGNQHAHLRNPIIVTGTKGKGSTAEILTSCLQASGTKVGLFTSPHLIDVRERIRVDGQRIPAETFQSIYRRMRPYIKKRPGGYRTVFEVLTAIAFEYFVAEGVDFAVLEVGLGGTHDATNVVQPVMSVVTPISLDHTHVLGESVAEIAERKMGIARQRTPVVSAPQGADVLRVIAQRCEQLRAPLYLVGRDLEYDIVHSDTGGSRFDIDGREYSIPLIGDHQVLNAATACLALRTIGREIVPDGLRRLRLKGRLEILEREPLVVLDAAHNAHSASVLASSLKKLFKNRRVTAVVSMLEKKDHEGFARELSPAVENVLVTKVDSPRSMDPNVLAAWFRGLVGSTEVIEDSSLAFERARRNAGSMDMVLVTGSFYLVGEILARYEAEK